MNWITSFKTQWQHSLQQGARLLIAFAVIVLLTGFGGRIPLQIEDLTAVACPNLPEYSNLTTSGSAANDADCYFLQGTIINQSGQPVRNADIFGRLYDANGNDIWPERTRLGALDEVPAGESFFSLRISVPSTSPMPLAFEQFKAAGFRGRVRR